MGHHSIVKNSVGEVKYSVRDYLVTKRTKGLYQNP